MNNVLIIDEYGFICAFVATQDGILKFYTLKDGERIIEKGVKQALQMIKPRWDGSEWLETADPTDVTTPNSE